MKGVILTLLGDFQQSLSVQDSWAGSPLKDGLLEGSQFLWELADGRWLQLATNHRSDTRLFEFYSKIDVHGGERVFWECLEEAKRRFPVTNRKAETQLVI